MKLALKGILILLLISIFISACGGSAATEQPALDELLTASVGTMVYSFFETQTAMYTPQTATPVSTPTFLPTFTPYPSPTFASPSATVVYFAPAINTFTPGAPTTTGTPPTATVNAGALGYGCNNLAFIRDVTVPAGTVMQKNEEFTKTWKVQNTGTCDWMFQYRLVYLGGEDLKASGDYIGKRVTVWDWAEVSVHLNAPKNAGTYTSYFRMADGGGHMFGETLTLSFVVAD